jgi:hypothetical protein
MIFTTTELFTMQMADASSQVDKLEKQLTLDVSDVTIAVVRRLQDQYRELAVSLGVALKILTAA